MADRATLKRVVSPGPKEQWFQVRFSLRKFLTQPTTPDRFGRLRQRVRCNGQERVHDGTGDTSGFVLISEAPRRCQEPRIPLKHANWYDRFRHAHSLTLW